MKSWNRRKDIDKRKDEIISLYSKNFTMKNISKSMNCDESVIKRILKENNIKIIPQKFYMKNKSPTNKLNLPEKEIVKMYLNKDISGTKIAKRFGCDFSVIYDIFKKHNIKMKGAKYFNKENISPTKGIKRLEESNEKNRLAQKKLWQDNEYRERQLKAQKRGAKIRPNKPEKNMIDLIQKNNLPFNYVGSGNIWFRGKTMSFNPDFLSKNPKYIIELFGDYWHRNTQKKDKERLATYSKYGYKTLVIWEHELKNTPQVVNKIKEFIKWH